MNPCKEDKCLIYPICLNKTKIECTELERYFIMKTKIPKDAWYLEDTFIKIWKELGSIFPKVRTFYLSDIQIDSWLTHRIIIRDRRTGYAKRVYDLY